MYNMLYIVRAPLLDENRVEEIVGEICESYTSKRKGGFKARCPVCGDSQKSNRIQRLHIDWYQKYDDWVVTCYNGGCTFRSGNVYSLYATVTGQSYNEAKKYIDQSVYNTEEIKQRLARKAIKKQIVEENTQVLDLDMDECLAFNDTTDDRVKKRYIDALRQFMKSRAIRKPCFVAFTGRYKNRYIIPIYIKGKMAYFQGRAMSDVIDPKYLNPVVDKSKICMNIDKFDRSKSIIMTEGIIDSFMVEDDQGSSVLGAHFDDEKIEQLLTLTNRDVILCFDNVMIDKSGYDEMIKFMDESKYKNIVKYFIVNRTDFKDLNDLRGIYDGSIYDYVVNNSFGLFNAKTKLSLFTKW